MLILAGVSISAIVGEDGILSKAQLASQKQNLASDLEALQLALMNHSITSLTDGEEELDIIVDDLLNQSLIDSVDGQKDDSGNYIDYNQYTDTAEDGTVTSRFVKVKKGDNSFRVFLNEDGTFSADVMTAAGGGTLSGGTYEVTEEAFASGEGITDPNDRGKFTIEGDTKVIFNDPLGVEADGITANGQMLSIEVKSGAKVKIYFNANSEKKAADGNTYYKLTNEGLRRSAIDIEPGGQLDLVIGKDVVVEVNSGFGEDADESIPGKGGYAGIHIPEGATINLYGNGTITAIGGKAGEGATINSGQSNKPGAGGGGAGAGIGGNGGNGGLGTTGIGNSGGEGENCGNINIYNLVTVYAYGGGGGSGGLGLTSTGGGGGGYPGAGIGGGGAGGAGGTCCTGAGGFSGGAGEGTGNTIKGVNGLYGGGSESVVYHGGGYFLGGLGFDKNGIDRSENCLGGFCAPSYVKSLTDMSGNGGVAGKGGYIKVSTKSKIYAFNGNLYTDDTSYQNGVNQCPIYLQFGVKIAKYEYLPTGTGSTEMEFLLRKISNQESIETLSYINTIYEENSNYISKKYITKNDVLSNVDMSKQGIGSGAGYMEVSNGTYTEDASMN